MDTFGLWLIVAIIFVFCFAISYLYRITETAESASGFLLADKSLGQTSVAHLLLSSSFGVNAIFYAAWLGYSLGGWALIIQGFWAASFFLLSRYSEHFSRIDSLHDFLGQKFGTTTKIAAACLSIFGIMFFVGWEVGIAEGAIKELEQSNLGRTSNGLIAAIVLATLVYTMIGGLKGNAGVNIFLNAVKILLLFALAFFAVVNFTSASGVNFWNAFFPPPDVLIKNFGLWGLITNILFNLSWQFVDNSSWQSVVAGVKSGRSRSHLVAGGIWVFLSIGVMGTLYGASLTQLQGVDEGNIIAMMTTIAPQFSIWIYFAIQIVLICCMISLLDGMFLAIALSVAKDILHINKVAWIRWVLLPVIAIAGILGVRAIQHAAGLGLFDLVYLVVISQLSLMGPVLVAFYTKIKIDFMWIALVFSFAIGCGSALTGAITSEGFYLQSAGTFTLLGSIVCSFVIYCLGKKDASSV